MYLIKKTAFNEEGAQLLFWLILLQQVLLSVSVYVRLQEGIETGHVVLGKVVLSGFLVVLGTFTIFEY